MARSDGPDGFFEIGDEVVLKKGRVRRLPVGLEPGDAGVVVVNDDLPASTLPKAGEPPKWYWVQARGRIQSLWGDEMELTAPPDEEVQAAIDSIMGRG